MYTNKLDDPHINYEAIGGDFDICIIRKNDKKFYKSDVLDFSTTEYKAASAAYIYGTEALVAFYKGSTNIRAFCRDIQEKYENEGVEAERARMSEAEKWAGEDGRILLQLLLNLRQNSLTDGKAEYNNVTGKLLYGLDAPLKSKWEKETYRTFLNIKISRGPCLSLNLATYRKAGENDHGPFYLYDPVTGHFRKAAKSDRPGERFVFGSKKGSHFTDPYFDISGDSDAAFAQSKAGVLADVLGWAERNLSKYASFKLKETDGYLPAGCENYGVPLSGYRKYFENRIITVSGVDGECLETAGKITEILKENEYQAEKGKPREDCFNIRVIREKDYYEKNKLPDPHADAYPFSQHMTLEKCDWKEKKENPKKKNSGKEEEKGKEKKLPESLGRALRELVIKDDIKNGKITTYGWEKLGFTGNVNFVTTRILEKTDPDKNTPEKRAYIKLSVDPEGKMAFTSIIPGEAGFHDGEWEKIDNFYAGLRNKYEYPEGFVYTDPGKIYAITRTDEVALPDIRKTKERLGEIKENTYYLDLESWTEEFAVEHPEHAEKANEILGKIEKRANEGGNPRYTAREIRALAGARTKFASDFDGWLFEKHGIRIMGGIRKKGNEGLFRIREAFCNVMYREGTDSCGEKEFYYYAGRKEENLNASFPRACHIRKVTATEGDADFKQYLPLMYTFLVGDGSSYTVLPFPFKYLREYEKMQ